MDQYAKYNFELHFFSSNQNKDGIEGATKITAQKVDSGNTGEILLEFKGDLKITQARDDPNEVGSSIPTSGGTEQMPEIAEEKNDDLFDSLEKMNQPEAEEQNQQDKEILEEIQKQEEKQQEPQPEKDEFEKEDEQSKEIQKQKDKKKEEAKEIESTDEDQTERSGIER
jgi:hypothetical protein